MSKAPLNFWLDLRSASNCRQPKIWENVQFNVVFEIILLNIEGI